MPPPWVRVMVSPGSVTIPKGQLRHIYPHPTLLALYRHNLPASRAQRRAQAFPNPLCASGQV